MMIIRRRRTGGGPGAVQGESDLRIIKLNIFLLLLLPLIALSALSSTAAETGEAARWLDLGWERFDREDWEGAEAAFVEAVRADDSSAGAYRGLSEALHRQGKYAELTRVVLEAVPRFTGRPEALRPLADILARHPATREGAVGLYRILLENDPADIRLRMELARNLAWSGRRKQAVEECRRVAEETGDAELRYQARRLEAQAQSWRGNQKEALRIYGELRAERPGDEGIDVGIADSWAWSGWSRRAEREYETILAERPSAEARVGLGEIARWEGRYAEAEKQFAEALVLRPEDRRALEGQAGVGEEAAPALTFIGGAFRDSSDWDRDSYAVFADFWKRKPVRLRTGAERSSYRQADDRQVWRTAVPVQAFWKAGPRFDGAAGLSLNDYGDGTDTVNGFLHGSFGTGGDRIRYRLDYDHYDMIDDSDPFRESYYNQAETIDVVPLEIDLDEFTGGVFVRFTGRLTLDAAVAWADISDGNERWTSFDRLSYRIPARDRFEVFGQFYYQNVDDRTPLYFDPSSFQGYSGGVRWEGERKGYFRFLFEASTGYYPNENDHFGGQLHGQAEWDLHERMALRLTANYLNSPEERGISGDNYEATYFGLTLVGRFPK